MDYVCLGLASEELEYVDTSLRVIMSVHAGLNCLSLLTWGNEDQKTALPGAAGARHEDRRLWAHRAGGGQRRARHPDDRRQEGRPLGVERREILDLARRRRRQLSRDRVDRSGKEEAARSGRPQRLHRRADVQGIHQRPDEGEVGHPRRQHRLVQDGRRRGAGGERAGAARRGVQDCDVRARSGPLHRRGGCDRPDSRLPRREREVRERAARRSASRSASTSS